jgi:hypothetical protein
LGNSGDEVIATGFDDSATEKTINGVTYHVYTHGDANAELWVQKGVTLREVKCGFVIKGESENDYSGYSVSNAGDVNGDGLDDLIVGAYQASLSGKSNVGKSYVVFGKQDNNAIELSAIVAGTGGFVINGESMGDESGYSVSNAGDVNGDGLDDLIVGAYGASSSAGKSYVIFGKTDTGSIDLSKLSCVVVFAKHNIRFTCLCLATWIGTPSFM